VSNLFQKPCINPHAASWQCECTAEEILRKLVGADWDTNS